MLSYIPNNEKILSRKKDRLSQRAHARGAGAFEKLHGLPAELRDRSHSGRDQPLRSRCPIEGVIDQPSFRRGAADIGPKRFGDGLSFGMQPKMRLLPELPDQSAPSRRVYHSGTAGRRYAGASERRRTQYQFRDPHPLRASAYGGDAAGL